MLVGITDRITSLGAIEKLYESKGIKFVFLNTPDENRFPVEILKKVDALLVWHARISTSTIKNLDRCKIVIRYGIGYDQVDADTLFKKGIALANTPSYCVEEVADTTLAMLLNLVRMVSFYDTFSKSYSNHLWQENHLNTLRSKELSVGLIGLGKIGIATALRLKPFGFSISAYDPYIKDGVAKAIGISYVEHLDDLLKKSDIISLHCPLTKETNNMVNGSFLNKMKPSGVLINTARGKIIDTLNLYHHMKKHRRFKAALDVLPQEPPLETDPLINAWKRGEYWINKRLIINPHNAYYSQSAQKEMRTSVMQTLWEALHHKKTKNVVNGIQSILS